jgi:hypothetical protein
MFLIKGIQCPFAVTRSPTHAFCDTSFSAGMLRKLSAVVEFASFTTYCSHGIQLRRYSAYPQKLLILLKAESNSGETLCGRGKMWCLQSQSEAS